MKTYEELRHMMLDGNNDSKVEELKLLIDKCEEDGLSILECLDKIEEMI